MNKLSSALVSLMSTPPELQYVALKNIKNCPRKVFRNIDQGIEGVLCKI